MSITIAHIANIRRGLLGVAAITIGLTGTIYGSKLKDDQIAAKRQEEFRKATPEDIIASIESRIYDLQRTRSEILGKVENVDRDIAMKASEKASGG